MRAIEVHGLCRGHLERVGEARHVGFAIERPDSDRESQGAHRAPDSVWWASPTLRFTSQSTATSSEAYSKRLTSDPRGEVSPWWVVHCPKTEGTAH